LTVPLFLLYSGIRNLTEGIKMKYATILTTILLLVLSVIANATEYAFTIEESFTNINKYSRGLDCYDAGGQLMITSRSSHSFRSYATMETDSLYTGSGYNSGWGGCMLEQSSTFVLAGNDQDHDHIILMTSPYIGIATDNPSGTGCFGMDCDEDGFIWQCKGAYGMDKMVLNSDSTFSIVANYSLSELEHAGGVTTLSLYNLGLTNHILIADNSSPNSFFLYEIIGSALVFVDQIPFPESVHQSRGLAFSMANQTFWWCYQETSSTDSVKVVRMTLEVDQALTQSTWANIKNTEW
jgi:hypothetical protein